MTSARSSLPLGDRWWLDLLNAATGEYLEGLSVAEQGDTVTPMEARQVVRTPDAAAELGIDLLDLYKLIERGQLERATDEFNRFCTTRASLDAYRASQ